MNYADLTQAASGLLKGDALLPVLYHPVVWGVGVLSLALLVLSHFFKAAPAFRNGIAGVVLLFVALGGTLFLSPGEGWLKENGALATKGSSYLGWKRTDAATFTRQEVLKLKFDLDHDMGVAVGVKDSFVKKGVPADVAEKVAMSALTQLHKGGNKAAAAQSSASAAPAEAK